jgi:hypothetical protein
MNRFSHTERTERTAALVEQLLSIVVELETIHPGRKFPLDGHLVGSIGEAAAEALFAIELLPASTAGRDALAVDGRSVEIKATYGTSGVGLRGTSHDAAAALIVLRLSKVVGVTHEVVYDGPIARVLEEAGAQQSNGQARLGLARLRQINASIPDIERVPRRGSAGD